MRSHTLPFRALGVVVVLAAGCTTVQADAPALTADDLQRIVASPVRTDQDRRMDAARHPVEFLPFTGVRPGMRVLDVSAGAGYTSQLLALAVGSTGTLYAQRPQPGEALSKRLAEHPQSNFVVVYRPFDDPVPPDAPKLDLVTLILNYHDITYLPVDRAKMNRRIYDALKPGGHYVIVDHSAKPGADIAVGKTLHRIDEAIVRREVQDAGFVLESESDFLRDAADSREASSGDSKIPTDKFALRFVKR